MPFVRPRGVLTHSSVETNDANGIKGPSCDWLSEGDGVCHGMANGA
jgi:hypothetical protein